MSNLVILMGNLYLWFMEDQVLAANQLCVDFLTRKFSE